MKATPRTTRPTSNTLIESFAVSARVEFIDYAIGCNRYFPVTLTIADADEQFKEWAHNLFKAYPTRPIGVTITIPDMPDCKWEY